MYTTRLAQADINMCFRAQEGVTGVRYHDICKQDVDASTLAGRLSPDLEASFSSSGRLMAAAEIPTKGLIRGLECISPSLELPLSSEGEGMYSAES